MREGQFVCVFCNADLPQRWNIDPDFTAYSGLTQRRQ
ncbi:hypothetical protein BJY54_001113 [Streptomyces nodosus]|nr:hypothetical protein [Streptomyces nodosus]